MVDLSQFATVGGLAVLIAVIVQFVKQWLPQPSGPSLFALVVGLVLSPLIGAVLGHILVPADVLSWIIGGFFAAVAATGGYSQVNNLLTGKPLSTSGPAPATVTGGKQ